MCAPFALPSAHAQTIEESIYYTSSATINTDIRGNDVIIGKMPGGAFGNAAGDTDLGTNDATAYTVTVVNGANTTYSPSFAGYFGLDVYNRNTLAITGGDVFFFRSHNTSMVNVSGGIVGNVDSRDTSTVNISGGDLYSSNAVVGRDTSTVNISGGNVGRATATASSVFNISGGNIASIFANGDTATVNFFGRSIAFSSAMEGMDSLGNPGVFYDVAWKQANGSLGDTRYFDLGGDVNNTTVQGVTFNGLPVRVGVNSAAPEPGGLALLGLALPFIGIVAGRKGRAPAKA